MLTPGMPFAEIGIHPGLLTPCPWEWSRSSANLCQDMSCPLPFHVKMFKP